MNRRPQHGDMRDRIQLEQHSYHEIDRQKLKRQGEQTDGGVVGESFGEQPTANAGGFEPFQKKHEAEEDREIGG